MLQPIAALPEGVLGFEASGEIQPSDYRDTLPVAERDRTIAWVAGDR